MSLIKLMRWSRNAVLNRKPQGFNGNKALDYIVIKQILVITEQERKEQPGLARTACISREPQFGSLNSLCIL